MFAAITLWNLPDAMVTRKADPAFVADCAVLLKPASQMAFSAFALPIAAHRAVLSKGLFRALIGRPKWCVSDVAILPKSKRWWSIFRSVFRLRKARRSRWSAERRADLDWKIDKHQIC